MVPLVVGVLGEEQSSATHEMREIPILRELCQSSGVDGHTQSMVVLVVGDQPLQSSLDYSSSHTEVTVGLIGSFLPHNNDI